MFKKLAPAIALLLLAPLLFIIVVSSSPSVGACNVLGDDVPIGPGLSSGSVLVAHANIKSSLAADAFRADMRDTTAKQPDFVSLNEMHRRSLATIEAAAPGYKGYRDPKARGEEASTAVLWRADRWQLVPGGTGRITIVESGPQKWDSGRSATWATVRDAEGATVSIVSVHHMIDPALYGPNKPKRQEIYQAGMQAVAALVTRLSVAGPVFLAGDLNSHYSKNPPAWGPVPALRTAGMKPTFDVLGSVKTHRPNGTIDYIFFQPAAAKAVSQSTQVLNSDHNLLLASFSFGDEPDVVDVGQTPKDSKTKKPKKSKKGGGSSRVVVARSGPGQTVANLDATQTQNAAAVVAAGRERGIPDQGIVVALAVASRESNFRNLANDGKGGDLKPDQAGIERSLKLPHDGVGTDHGSLGIMQQQWPSWGTMKQLMTPKVSAGIFYDALLQVDGWEDLPVTVAAQTVQKSAYPDAYASHEQLARQILAQLDPTAGAIAVDASADAACAAQTVAAGDLSCPPTKSPAEAGLTPDALLVLRCVDAVFGSHSYGGVGTRSNNPGSDHPSGRAVDVMIANWDKPDGIAHGDAVAAWVIEHQKELGVTYVIWRARIWSGNGWKPYRHPSGATDPTNMHMDHVHVSVAGTAGTGFPTGGASGPMVFPLPAGSYVDQKNYGNTGKHWETTHTGTDLSSPCGTPVAAVHAGTIEIRTGLVWPGPWLVSIKTGKGTLSTSYAHMNTVSVTNGQTVKAGQLIGTVGKRGNTTGCHLHIEVRPTDTNTIDPTAWLAQNTGTGARGRPV